MNQTIPVHYVKKFIGNRTIICREPVLCQATQEVVCTYSLDSSRQTCEECVCLHHVDMETDSEFWGKSLGHTNAGSEASPPPAPVPSAGLSFREQADLSSVSASSCDWLPVPTLKKSQGYEVLGCYHLHSWCLPESLQHDFSHLV